MGSLPPWRLPGAGLSAQFWVGDGTGQLHLPARVAPLLTIYVDADSCPVKEEVYRVAERYGIHVALVSNSWMKVRKGDRVKLVLVPEEGDLDAVDGWIVETIRGNDIVITDDIILASRCLQGGAGVISPRGRVFTSESIGEALSTREFKADLREAGAITGGPPPFEKRDRSNFLQRLDEAVQRVRRSQEGV
jgi:uncharacterized protein YaiI (UPF0178 family)